MSMGSSALSVRLDPPPLPPPPRPLSWPSRARSTVLPLSSRPRCGARLAGGHPPLFSRRNPLSSTPGPSPWWCDPSSPSKEATGTSTQIPHFGKHRQGFFDKRQKTFHEQLFEQGQFDEPSSPCKETTRTKTVLMWQTPSWFSTRKRRYMSSCRATGQVFVEPPSSAETRSVLCETGEGTTYKGLPRRRVHLSSSRLRPRLDMFLDPSPPSSSRKRPGSVRLSPLPLLSPSSSLLWWWQWLLVSWSTQRRPFLSRWWRSGRAGLLEACRRPSSSSLSSSSPA